MWVGVRVESPTHSAISLSTNSPKICHYNPAHRLQESTDGESESGWEAPADCLAALSPELLLYRAARAHNLPVMCQALALGASTEWHNSADGMRAPIHQVKFLYLKSWQ
jgi:hypothetical protein